MVKSTFNNQLTDAKTDPFLESVTYVNKTQRRVLERREIVFQCLNKNLLPKIEAKEIMEKVNKGLGKSISHTIIYNDLRAYKQLFTILNKKDGAREVGKGRIEPAIKYFLQDWKEGEQKIDVRKVDKNNNLIRKKLNLIVDMIKKLEEEIHQILKKLERIEKTMKSNNKKRKIGFSVPKAKMGITESQQTQ